MAFSLSQNSWESNFIHQNNYTALPYWNKDAPDTNTARFQWAEGLSIRAHSLVAITFNRDLIVTTVYVVRMFVFKRITTANCKYKFEFNL